MQTFLNSFKNLAKCEEVRTDNNVFKLHYKFSVILLIVFSILLSSKQYFGDPIDCDVESKKETVNVFCWVSGTFIVQNQRADGYYRPESLEGLGNGKDKFTLLYYQWVCLIFCIQALLFYLPRYLWKAWEGDLMGQLVKDLCGPIITEKWSKEYKEKMRDYILYTDNHNVFAYRFAFCEFLNLCNLVFQVLFMDWYLNGKFSHYGYSVATKPWPKAANSVFPKRAKCTYTNYGFSGSDQSFDALCVLPLNILNEKFFLILWYWITILFFVTICALAYRFLFLYWQSFRTYLLMAQVRSLSRKNIQVIGQHLSHGQFFLLYNMGKNMNPIVYKELLISISQKLGTKIDITLDI